MRNDRFSVIDSVCDCTFDCISIGSKYVLYIDHYASFWYFNSRFSSFQKYANSFKYHFSKLFFGGKQKLPFIL